MVVCLFGISMIALQSTHGHLQVGTLAGLTAHDNVIMSNKLEANVSPDGVVHKVVSGLWDLLRGRVCGGPTRQWVSFQNSRNELQRWSREPTPLEEDGEIVRRAHT